MKFLNIILALVVLAFAASKKSRSHRRRGVCKDDEYDSGAHSCLKKKAKNESCIKNDMCKSGHCDMSIKLCGDKKKRRY